jgi:pimeloyl-ACP methyl ester carboxylesterase
MAATSKVAHRTVKIDGLDIFYREAGPKDAPAILLLHGFPTSSHMFRNLIPALADEFRLVAPDFPGFGTSSMPPRDQFNYTFDNLADVVEKFTEKVGLKKYALYVQDYGAPIGYRLAVKHPDRVSAIVGQNGNAYDEGLDNDFWKPIKAYWKEPQSKELREALRPFTKLEATKWQYTHGTRAPFASRSTTALATNAARRCPPTFSRSVLVWSHARKGEGIGRALRGGRYADSSSDRGKPQAFVRLWTTSARGR